MALLELKDVNTFYGAVHALRGVSLTVEEGEIVTLIGSNGAGKTTTLRTISGLERARSGSITLNGQSIESLPPHQIVALGIGHAPEGRRVFARMSVRENLEMGAFLRRGADVEQDFKKVFELFPRLKEREFQAAGTMSGGEQQMLAIGRALMGNPRFLMLDEPSLGIAPRLISTIFEKIVEINRSHGITILLVEQNANLALEVSSRAYVLETGRIAMQGESKTLRADPRLRATYLGG